MKLFTIALLVLFAVFQARICHAADILPDCGALCIQKSTLESSCAPTNATCICIDPELNLAILECVSVSCTVREQLTTQKYSKDSCGVVPRDRTASVAAVGVTFGALALLVFGLRIISKVSGAGGELGMDDYVMCLAVALTIPLCALSVVLSRHGLGLDIWNVSFYSIEQVSYFYFWDELLYLSALPLTKISILCFYLRIFPAKRFCYCVYVLIGINIGYLIAFVCVSIWQCKPLDAAWKKWDGTYAFQCNNINLQSWTSAAINVILDFAIVVLPMPELYKLSMSKKKKIHIMLMFGVGIFVTIVSCLRLSTLLEFGNTTNMTQDYVNLGIWSTIEVPVGIICACMPAIRSLFRHTFPTLLQQTQQDTSAVSQLSAKIAANNRVEKDQIHVAHNVVISSKTKFSRHDASSDSFVPLVDMTPHGESKV